MQASGEIAKVKTAAPRNGMESEIEERKPIREIIDRKDLAALWAIAVLFSLLCILVGLAWQPVHYEIIPSRDRDPEEAMTQNSQNQVLADALNQERVKYDSETMGKIIASRPFFEVLFFDFLRILLVPTLPILAIGSLIRKTLLESKKRRAPGRPENRSDPA
jgi:hypothetical protein